MKNVITIRKVQGDPEITSEFIIDLLEDSPMDYVEVLDEDKCDVYALVTASNCHGGPSCEPDEKCDCKALWKLSEQKKVELGFPTE